MCTQLLAKNLIFYSRIKHVKIDFHIVRELVMIKKLRVKHMSCEDQVVHILTKSIPVNKFAVLYTTKLIVLPKHDIERNY